MQDCFKVLGLTVRKRIEISLFSLYSPTDGVSPFHSYVRILAECQACHTINQLSLNICTMNLRLLIGSKIVWVHKTIFGQIKNLNFKGHGNLQHLYIQNY